MVNAWSETSLPTILYNDDLKDIYNADEFGLFCQCVPNKTYQRKSETCDELVDDSDDVEDVPMECLFVCS